MGYLFKYDAFISYSRGDERWVEQLAKDLKEEGFDIFLDKWSLIPGEAWERQLLQAMRKSRTGILILSPSSITSENVRSEIIALQQHALENKLRLIPVLYKACLVPRALDSYERVDFSNESEDAYQKALKRLTEALHPKGWALKWILLLVLLVTLAPTACVGGVSLANRASLASTLRETQESIQKMDARVQTLSDVIETKDLVPKENGESVHCAPNTGERLATDIWNKGRLVSRKFYQDKHIVATDEFMYADIRNMARRAYRRFYQGETLVAVDEFLYDGETILGKRRDFLDGQKRIFLTDTYTQAGILTLKRYMPDGRKDRSVDLIDDLRSPLPPPLPPIAVYR